MNQKYTYTGKLKDLPILNFNRTKINFSDYFNEPSYLVEDEINFANRFTRDKYLDFEEESLIELEIKPSDIKNFVVNILREYEGHKKRSL
ncbi:MAG: hypothetical protein K9G37_11845 [Crocinitomicaceae bacterium]|nr:hypothetical protein [Crocinitomicaceae bacterium]